jgi:hypothetical protein
MSEIDSVEQLVRYNQNFFNVKKFWFEIWN